MITTIVNHKNVITFVKQLQQINDKTLRYKSRGLKFNTIVLVELSKTEYQVAELVTRGYSEKEIACKLFISPKTVHTHTYNIRKKWNARCAVDVARIFILQLDNPKKYFTVLSFLIIQFHIITQCADMDLRRPARTSVRIARTRNNNRKWN